MMKTTTATAVFAGPATITKAVWEQTNQAVKFRAWVSLFNNIVYLGRAHDGAYTFRATNAVARAIAAAGFDVFDRGLGVFGARRCRTTVIEGGTS